MVPGKLAFFVFSIRKFKDQTKSFFLLSPVGMNSVSSGYVYSMVLLVSIWIANIAALAGARILTMNMLHALWDITFRLPMKITGLLSLLFFHFLVSKLYSSFFDDGSFSQVYFHISMLASVHHPLLVFALSIPRLSWKFTPCAMVMCVQGLVAEHMTRRSILSAKSTEPEQGWTCLIAISCIVHAVFYALVMHPLLVDY